ncbi:hypothetical protein B0T25DRAFT_236824 [Lasiosphaeria hispida]|uniref:Heterokaryon incompatibility domain-containing protein n=1 Tax=Lasiosphaeria hispida TaxID=260671 RepID=A0AAJ0MC37_9PEZI|nr:hypothetical protein B0T25DRAFT_236824 [Lasiosphaeria hispida]
MKIYLVRVCDRSDGSLYIEYKPDATTDDEYIAISHVWGTPETVEKSTVDGVKWDVSLSPGKRDILTLLRRDDICGDDWFWMDLFCIDQTDSPTISIADQLMAIPLVYKSSRCVKVLVESPVCQRWQDTVMEAFERKPINPEALQEQELGHGGSCPHLLFTDPWFERLWTRQEGLYANVLRFVVLQPAPCARQEREPARDGQGQVKAWISHGTLLEKRFLAEEFLRDKLAYHGKREPSQDASAADSPLLSSLYFDVVYRHGANFTLAYECEPGPDPKYSPIMAAWRSQRRTTKPCDYILAVFPDIAGYRVPSEGARKMSFPELLRHAMTQPAMSANFQLAPKVPRGLNGPTPRATESALPWLAEEPSSIGEAYDTFTAVDIRTGEEPTQNTSTGRKRASLVPGAILNLQETNAAPSGLESLKEDWKGFVNMNQHVALASASGPCTGLARRNLIINDETAVGPLLHQYFAEEFMKIAVSEYLLPRGGGMEGLSLRTEGVLSFDQLLLGGEGGGVSEEEFTRELKRFLVCLICGTSLPTADRVLEVADVARLSTSHGPLLAVVHRATRLSMMNEQQQKEKLVLLCGSMWPVEGFHIGVRINGGASVRGRTIVPNQKVWDSVAAVAAAAGGGGGGGAAAATPVTTPPAVAPPPPAATGPSSSSSSSSSAAAAAATVARNNEGTAINTTTTAEPETVKKVGVLGCCSIL